MKGMQKIKRGKNFAGVVFYALRPASHHKTPPSVIGGNMDGSNAGELIAEFNATKALRPDVAKPVWHNSLRLPKNEALTDAQWSEIADDYMSRMGFSETHLRCYVLHDDAAGQHIHIIASRIELSSGKLYLGKNENLISTRIIQDLEQDYQLTRTKGPKASPAAPSPKPKLKKSRNEMMIEKRTGELCPKGIIQNALNELLDTRQSITDFVQQLVAQNIRPIPNIASTGRMNGFSFEYNGIAFKASQLGKGYSWSALQSRIDYQQERDNAFLFKLKSSVRETSVSATHDMVITIDTPETTTEYVNRPIEALILDKRAAGQDEYSIASVEALLPEAVATNKEAIATETLKVAPKRSYRASTFRWLETIPYLNTIITIFKNLKIPTLKRPQKHKTITSVRVVEITPLPQKNLIESAPQSRRASLSM
ncbi:relaxase [Salmonella enterica subsp. enterica serovar London]|uniref:Relaxase/mobilization nuclease domain-containing protein n=1 Tax=Salmonella enterica subsp. enterica serovar London TaxID=149390 RepID=A0A731YL04_SALET|nr:relaxase/mobilization nuclease domain-containing protein [Salmonella enterica]EBX9326934.1 relaxase [Salmonella enterica subsp. enterica serovar London]EDV4312233.1 relaxase/mobilization nuclease domain-containing protein [Salmonella enterica subsp. enterica]EGI5836007.1 relaxase/mobilization nuclease domain-containing protein [Salmonella enterica subsp. enterica serovar Omderman]EJD6657893.1 relaxase/mobilization nuclease domain-containing protein [Enterobacter cloacae]EAO9153230.1 relaxas